MGNIIIQNVNSSTINIGGNDAENNANAIKSLIAQGNTMAALNRLPSNDNDVILLKARLTRLNLEKMRGVVLDANFNLELNSINRYILDKIAAYDCSVVDNVAGIDKTISAPLIDPQELETIITTEYGGYLAEYKKVFEFGARLLSYLKNKCDNRTFDIFFQGLNYAVQDLGITQNIENMNSVINAIKEKRDTILQLLASDAKETTLEELYHAAESESDPVEFMPKFEAFLNKYLSLKAVPNKVEVLNQWNDQRDCELNRGGTDEFIKIMFGQFKFTWLHRFRHCNN